MDGADVGMIQKWKWLALLAGTRQGLRVSGHAIRQELQSNENG